MFYLKLCNIIHIHMYKVEWLKKKHNYENNRVSGAAWGRKRVSHWKRFWNKCWKLWNVGMLMASVGKLKTTNWIFGMLLLQNHMLPNFEKWKINHIFWYVQFHFWKNIVRNYMLIFIEVWPTLQTLKTKCCFAVRSCQNSKVSKWLLVLGGTFWSTFSNIRIYVLLWGTI